MLTGQTWTPRQKPLEKNTNDAAVPSPPPRERAGLCVSVFRAASHPSPGVSINDWLLYSGIFIPVVQLGIASISCALWRRWSILMITACGILLAFASGVLLQWKAEKWQCRRGAKTVILTKGNGAQHEIVVLGHEWELDLEDLAAAAAQKEKLPSTTISAALLAILWTALLIAVLGLKRDSWQSVRLACCRTSLLQEIGVFRIASGVR
jgi:hypothetical protein